LEENEKLHREILRLKQDNAGLIKKCKHAMSDKDGIIVSMSVLLKNLLFHEVHGLPMHELDH
jgi:hypothetical protein